MASLTLDERIARLEAVNEIQNIMGKYEFLLMEPSRGDEMVALWARRDDSSFEIGDWGTFKGEKIRTFFDNMAAADLTGCSAEVALTSSVIEVAGDGNTAKAVWMSPGYETMRDMETGKLRPGWIWTKYACDFIKENGEWKLWHLKNFLVFFADYDRSWVEAGTGEHFSRRPGGLPPFPGALPSPHRHAPYDPNGKYQLLPAFPYPYHTYDGSMDWVDPAR